MAFHSKQMNGPRQERTFRFHPWLGRHRWWRDAVARGSQPTATGWMIR